ncbi:MAG: HAD family hydrolase [Gemmatimonadales bacterium]|nr:MAG: HAD family hydrolase [Gemmatimonadales bacterium]
MTPGPTALPRPLSAILLDLDGTLIATRRLYLEAFADALEPVLGHRPSHDEMIALRPRAEIRFLEEMGGTSHHGGVMDRFFQAYHERHEDDFEGVYTGVPALLDELRALGRPLGIVTGKSRRSWSITGPRVGLGDFQVEVFDDDVPASKPDPAGLRQAVAARGVSPAQAIYVGDSVTDLEAARRAGLFPVAVLWSKRAHEREPFAAAARENGGLAVATPIQLGKLVRQSVEGGG